MPGSPRKVILDDDFPFIHYTGPWFRMDSQDYNAKGGMGNPYDGSLHGTTGVASFTYSFIGSTGQIMGAADISNSSSAGIINPSYECILDGVSIPVKDPPSSPTTTWCFCEWNSTIGSHTITVNVEGRGKNLWFDQLIYVPDPKIVLKNATVLVTHTDTALRFDSGWLPADADSRIAAGGGSVVTFPFFGSGLSWFGNVPGGNHHNPMIGFYSIDNQPPINFTVPPRPGKKNKVQKLFFKTLPLPQGPHTLTVTSLGAAHRGATSLALSHLVLNNAELPVLDASISQTVTASAPGSLPSATDTTSASQASPTVGGQHTFHFGDPESQNDFPYQAIVGGAVGCLVLTFLALFAYCFFRRRRRAKLGSTEATIGLPPPYTPPKDISQISNTPASRPSTIGRQEYPFALPVESNRNNFQNFAKRFTSVSTRPNSLFQTARLSALPVKRQPSLASSASSRTYRPYISRARSNARSSTGSTATLLPSAPPSRKASIISFRDDRTVVVEHKDDEVRLPHARPPEGTQDSSSYNPG